MRRCEKLIKKLFDLYYPTKQHCDRNGISTVRQTSCATYSAEVVQCTAERVQCTAAFAKTWNRYGRLDFGKVFWCEQNGCTALQNGCTALQNGCNDSRRGEMHCTVREAKGAMHLLQKLQPCTQLSASASLEKSEKRGVKGQNAIIM